MIYAPHPFRGDPALAGERHFKEINGNIPIILQAADSLENAPEDMISNFGVFLIKPIWSDELIWVLSKYLDRKSSQ